MTCENLLLLASSPMLLGFVSFGWSNLQQGIEEQVRREHAQSELGENASAEKECADSGSASSSQTNKCSDAKAEELIQKKISAAMSQFADYSLF